MRIPVKSVSIKAPLFIEGKNFTDKLGNTDEHKAMIKRGELSMLFDDKMNSIIVTYLKSVSVVHVSATLAWSPLNVEDLAEKKKVAPTATQVIKTPEVLNEQ